MANGGILTVEARNVDLDDGYADIHVDVTAGPHVMLSVSDTGIGMDAATRERIFEPFFTTKEVGQGTGLGLATVYGIVKQSGGHIWVYSEPSRGSSFKVFLPISDVGVPDRAPAEPPSPTRGGKETILLVEDDAAVRRYMTVALGRYGYTVVSTSSGDEALAAADGQRFDLVISDIVMPGMSASELASRLRAKSPRLRILYMSGYTEDTIVHRGVLDPGVAFLGKPFSAEALARKVRETLEAP
jgi:two-component system cell cycle sensor histidine kinase/response regulator CckA